jgi:hypothetical protein
MSLLSAKGIFSLPSSGDGARVGGPRPRAESKVWCDAAVPSERDAVAEFKTATRDTSI